MLADEIRANVKCALEEDLGGVIDLKQDLTAQLIPADRINNAKIITREAGIFCGKEWVNEIYNQLGGNVTLNWSVEDGQEILPGQELCALSGNARTMLTAERCSLNFLQTLCGVATVVNAYAKAIAGTSCRLLDTRKTIPGLRAALKYAVQKGGGNNHRFGLYDMYLIKENHIVSCGGVVEAISKARELNKDLPIEIEVETIDELKLALEAQADIILLDNFDYAMIEEAVQICDHKAKLEISGNVTLETIARFAASGVDYISVGALTKNIRTLDLSMRFIKD